MNTPLVAHIDHFVLAAPDLERACDQFEAATGVRPAFGGAHPGGGTHNALVAFDESSYLEIIAPDPAQPATGMSAPMARLPEPTLLHWAVRLSGLAGVSARVKQLGWSPTEVRRMNRTPPGGARLDWELFGVREHRYGGLVPFFIDWLGSAHPATTSPRVGAITSVRLTTPQPAQLQTLMTELGLVAGSMSGRSGVAAAIVGISIAAGEPGIALAFAGPRGEVVYRTAAPAGFTLG